MKNWFNREKMKKNMTQQGGTVGRVWILGQNSVHKTKQRWRK